MTDQLRRREFLRRIGGGAAALGLAGRSAEAKQAGEVTPSSAPHGLTIKDLLGFRSRALAATWPSANRGT